MFMESLTLGDAVSDPELLRIQREMAALDVVEAWKRGNDDDEDEVAPASRTARRPAPRTASRPRQRTGHLGGPFG
jgi:hypothetical protein